MTDDRINVVITSVVIGYSMVPHNMSELQHPDIDASDYSKLLAGHLGHLTASQEESLETFKQNLRSANLYNPKTDDSGCPSHDDTTLLCVYNQSSPLLALYSKLTQQIPPCPEV